MGFKSFLHREPTRPKLVELRSAKWFIIFTVSFAASTDYFMYGLIVPVTPTALERRVGISKDDIQSWNSILLALYSAATLAFSPVVGYLADRFESRRWPLLFGLVALGAATALLCIGTNLGLWIAGRLFQGMASAVVWTVGIALLVDTVGKEGFGQAVGYVSMALSMGTVAGPLLGGVLYQHGGYYSVFGLAFGLIAIDIFLRVVLIEQKHAIPWLAPERRPLSPTLGEKKDDTAASNAQVAASSAVSSIESLEKPKHSRHPLKQIAALLGSPRLSVALWGYFVVSLVLSSFDSVLPLFVEETFGWQQTGQGLIFFPIMLPHLVDPITGTIIDKYPKSTRYLVSGAFLGAVPVAVLLRVVKNDTLHDKVVLCALLALLGLCVAIAMTPLAAEVFFSVNEKEAESPDSFGRGGAMALAFGLTNMSFAAGTLIGPFFAGFIRQSAGWGTMGWAMGLITGVSALPVLLFLGGYILRKPIVKQDQAGSD
ncbi:hypothetical protein N7466_008745 [Penicillium verhagenii]|uniref:uncharacterized protein n=1 Tax=Penicillium verhagenii TaxID=1562060 RepID=UPI0025454D52|nr:uncharacterized protein N7466_008745 [Penicillium verhagenii]KAJ5924558.1 hypothetical protein N7466_008745 [Penicillium verhagenii]